MKICYCLRNDMKSKPFLESFNDFSSNNLCDARINWIVKKVKQLFKLKSKKLHPSYVVYEDVCTRQNPYIGEMKWNF